MRINEEYENELLNKETEKDNTKNKNTIEVLKKLNENSYKNKIRQYLIENGTLKLYCDDINIIDDMSELNCENKSQPNQKNYIAQWFNELIKEYEKEGVTVNIKNHNHTTIIGFYVNSKHNSYTSNDKFDTIAEFNKITEYKNITTEKNNELIKNNYYEIDEFKILTQEGYMMKKVIFNILFYAAVIIIGVILVQTLSIESLLNLLKIILIIWGGLMGFSLFIWMFRNA